MTNEELLELARAEGFSAALISVDQVPVEETHQRLLSMSDNRTPGHSITQIFQ